MEIKLGSQDYQRLGEELSSLYLTQKSDLTKSLEKVANTLGLNTEQTQRVAEIANVETYLALTKQNNGGYVDFPVAQASVVKVAQAKSHTMENDYFKKPESSDNLSWLDDLYGTKLKTASVAPDLEKTAGEKLTEFYGFDAVGRDLDLAMTKLFQKEASLLTIAEYISDEIKQHKQSGFTKVADLLGIVKVATPMSTIILEDYPDVTPSSLHKDEIYTDTNFYKAASVLGDLVKDYDKAYKGYLDVKEKIASFPDRPHKRILEKKASYEQSGKIVSMLNKINEKNRIYLPTAAAALTTAAVLSLEPETSPIVENNKNTESPHIVYPT